MENKFIATVMNTGFEDAEVKILRINDKIVTTEHKVECVSDCDNLMFIDEFEWTFEERDFYSSVYVLIKLV